MISARALADPSYWTDWVDLDPANTYHIELKHRNGPGPGYMKLGMIAPGAQGVSQPSASMKEIIDIYPAYSSIYSVYKLTMVGFVEDEFQGVFIGDTSWNNSLTHDNNGEPDLMSADRLKSILKNEHIQNFHVIRYPIDVDGNPL